MGLEDDIRAARDDLQQRRTPIISGVTTKRGVQSAIEAARPQFLEFYEHLKRYKAAKPVPVGLAPFGSKAYVLSEFAVDNKGNLLYVAGLVPHRKIFGQADSIKHFIDRDMLTMQDGRLIATLYTRDGLQTHDLVTYLRTQVIKLCAQA